jgi:hypothetical protein
VTAEEAILYSRNITTIYKFRKKIRVLGFIIIKSDLVHTYLGNNMTVIP